VFSDSCYKKYFFSSDSHDDDDLFARNSPALSLFSYSLLDAPVVISIQTDFYSAISGNGNENLASALLSYRSDKDGVERKGNGQRKKTERKMLFYLLWPYLVFLFQPL
jgi:hypothetical protein